MTRKQKLTAIHCLYSVLFPAFLQSVGAGLLFFWVAAPAHAEMPPHGRPGNLRPLPGVSIGVGGSASGDNTQQYGYLEGKVTHKLMLVLDLNSVQGEESDVAINGALDVESDGQGLGIYYQLPSYKNTFLTAAVRQTNGEFRDAETILSGSSQVGFLQERVSTEVSLLAEHDSWARGRWQPYVGVGFRYTDINTDISTTGGRQISETQSEETSGQFTGGVHYQYKRFSGFLEGTASSANDAPFLIHIGLRFGFFDRPDSVK